MKNKTKILVAVVIVLIVLALLLTSKKISLLKGSLAPIRNVEAQCPVIWEACKQEIDRYGEERRACERFYDYYDDCWWAEDSEELEEVEEEEDTYEPTGEE